MSCLVIKGCIEFCKDMLGGIKVLYFVNFVEVDGVFIVIGSEVIVIDVVFIIVYKYEIFVEVNIFD